MKKLLTLIMILGMTVLNAQETETTKTLPKFLQQLEFSGSIDGYFRQNISGPNGKDAIAPNTSFANKNGFALGMANLILSYESKKVGAVVDLVYGPRGEEAVFESKPNANIINQLYMYWNVSDVTTITFGNFNTFLGYEVISPTGNFNYSTSYMFSYGPFSHTGLKVDFAFSKDWSALLAVMNDNDLTEFNPTNNYTLGAQLGYAGTYLNVLYGPQFQIDLTTGFDISDQFFLGLNSTYFTLNDGDGSFYGAALYPQYSFTDHFTLGCRAEYFVEKEGGVGAIGSYDADGEASVFDLTLTANYSIGNLAIIPEFRLDDTSEKSFYNKDMEPTNSLSSFLIAAVYKF